MAKQKERYKAWGEAHMNAWVKGDVEAEMDFWAEDCAYMSVNPFGEHSAVQGREAIRQDFESMSANWSNKKLMENEVLSANKERGIFHTWVSWTSKDGKEWACTYINIVSLDENDKCTKYTEWNVVKAKEYEAEDSD